MRSGVFLLDSLSEEQLGGESYTAFLPGSHHPRLSVKKGLYMYPRQRLYMIVQLSTKSKCFSCLDLYAIIETGKESVKQEIRIYIQETVSGTCSSLITSIMSF